MRKQQMPDWVTELFKEFTRPPYFLQHLLDTQKDGQTQATQVDSAPATEADKQSGSGSGRRSSPAVPRTPTADTGGPEQTAAPLDGQGGTTFAERQVLLRQPAPHRQRQTEPEFVKTALGAESQSESRRKRPWPSVFRQAGFQPDVAKRYGWSVREAHPAANVIRVVTKNGVYALKRTHISADRVRFVQRALRYLERQGFERTAMFALNAKKQPFVAHSGQVYYATKWVDGNNVNFASPVQVGEVARTLAELHELSRGFETEAYNPPMEFSLGGMLRERTDDLRSLLVRAEGKKQPDEFDEILLRLAPGLRQDAEKSIRVCEDGRTRQFLERDEHLPGLCHLDVIPGNFIYTPLQQVVAIDFDLATFAPRVLDLAHLLRRSLQLQNWRSEVAYTCFLHYNNVRAMTPEEYLLVQSFLTFPYRAWRVAHTRYRAFRDSRQVEELREYAAQESRRQAFLEAYAKQITREVD